MKWPWWISYGDFQQIVFMRMSVFRNWMNGRRVPKSQTRRTARLHTQTHINNARIHTAHTWTHSHTWNMDRETASESKIDRLNKIENRKFSTPVGCRVVYALSFYDFSMKYADVRFGSFSVRPMHVVVHCKHEWWFGKIAIKPTECVVKRCTADTHTDAPNHSPIFSAIFDTHSVSLVNNFMCNFSYFLFQHFRFRW